MLTSGTNLNTTEPARGKVESLTFSAGTFGPSSQLGDTDLHKDQGESLFQGFVLLMGNNFDLSLRLYVCIVLENRERRAMGIYLAKRKAIMPFLDFSDFSDIFSYILTVKKITGALSTKRLSNGIVAYTPTSALLLCEVVLKVRERSVH